MTTGVAAIVLAAGESSRMGRPKPLLPLDDGETFLSHLLGEIRASRVERTVIVLGFHPEVVLEAMPEISPQVVVNEGYQQGQLSSLHVGLHTLGDEPPAVLMFLADHPFISRTVIDAMIQAYERDAPAMIVPTHGGRRGHPTLFARALIPELLAAPLDQGARVVVRAHASELLELPVDDVGVLADVDTPQQYEEWLAYWRALR
jgi:molybdenum cofactor cytidylyltransferase